MKNKDLKVEPPLTRYMYTKASAAKIPLGGTFELSPVCNFNCKMCYVRKSPEEVLRHSRSNVSLERWLEIAREAKQAGMLYLLLTGGEPFLWPDFWALYEKLSQMGFLISINTNGSLIDDNAVSRLVEMPPVRVNITLYGSGEEPYRRLCGVSGAYARVDRAVTKLQDAGIAVKLNGSLTPDNASDLEACISYAERHELIYEVATYMFPPVRRDESMVGRNERFTPEEAAYYRLKGYRLQFGKEMYQKYLENIVQGVVPPMAMEQNCIDPMDGKIRCRAGRASFWITWDEWLTPCGMMTEPRIELKGKNFSDAWEELVKTSEELKLSGVCTKCPNQKLCHSCAAMAEAETGTPSGIPRYLCENVTALKRLAEKELAQIKEKQQ